jgi:ATP-dependent DNA helicase RecG
MEALELLELIALGETSTVQFKRTVESPDKLAAELCAFANSEGGRLLFGVENDGTITGVTPDQVRELTSTIANVAANNIREPLFPTCEVVKVQNHNVLVVGVPESQAKPHFDKNGAIWVKNMADKRRVTSREELRRIFQDAHIFSADEMPVPRTSLEDLDLEALEAFYLKHYSQKLNETGLPLATLAANLNVARDHHLTLAGLLFFARQPQKYRPELITKAVAYPGESATDTATYLDSEDLDGTLPDQLAKAKAFLRRNLVKPQGEQNINTEGQWEIPEQALEELLVNMLVHRNYFISAPNKVFIFSNRVEIHSPGSLPNQLTVDQIKAGNSICRNPILLTLASKLLPYRGIGTGIRRALALHPQTEFFNDVAENRFRTVLTRITTRR